MKVYRVDLRIFRDFPVSIRQLVILLIVLSGLGQAQYNSETVTEKSFEQSDAFFQSYFLNPFGLDRFGNLAVGLIDDPFLNLHQNPAALPDLKGKSTHLYLDFRGDRTRAPIIEFYGPIRHTLLDQSDYRPDPRWYSNTRSEPTPSLSLGALFYPLGAQKGLLLGGSFQYLQRDEPFYSVPDWIYSPYLFADTYGRGLEDTEIAVTDRFSGIDEMLIRSNRLSAFAALPITDRLSIGISANGVIQSRDGLFEQNYRDAFSNNNSENLDSRERNQDYRHIDINGGFQFRMTKTSLIGLKGGYLQGDVDQSFLSDNSYVYNYSESQTPDRWSNYERYSLTNQEWRHDGGTRYGRLHLRKAISPRVRLQGQLFLARSDIDISNRSLVQDTLFSESMYSYNDGSTSSHRHVAALQDVRSGTGKRQENNFNSLLNIDVQLTPRNRLITGVSYSQQKNNIDTHEPVSFRNFSDFFHHNSGYDPYSELRRTLENKTLDWQYQSIVQRIQIPILTHFQFDEHWGMMIGITKSLVSWEIKESTLAIFDRREETDGGGTVITTNFGERYTQPTRRLTEEDTDMIARFDVAISPEFTVNLLVDPDFNTQFRIAQWWLGFKSTF